MKLRDISLFTSGLIVMGGIWLGIAVAVRFDALKFAWTHYDVVSGIKLNEKMELTKK